MQAGKAGAACVRMRKHPSTQGLEALPGGPSEMRTEAWCWPPWYKRVGMCTAQADTLTVRLAWWIAGRAVCTPKAITPECSSSWVGHYTSCVGAGKGQELFLCPAALCTFAGHHPARAAAS